MHAVPDKKQRKSDHFSMRLTPEISAAAKRIASAKGWTRTDIFNKAVAHLDKTVKSPPPEKPQRQRIKPLPEIIEIIGWRGDTRKAAGAVMKISRTVESQQRIESEEVAELGQIVHDLADQINLTFLK